MTFLNIHKLCYTNRNTYGNICNLTNPELYGSINLAIIPLYIEMQVVEGRVWFKKNSRGCGIYFIEENKYSAEDSLLFTCYYRKDWRKL